MKKILFTGSILMYISIFLLLSNYVCGQEKEKKVDFVTIDKDKGNGIGECAGVVVTNEEEWNMLWNRIYAGNEQIPEIPKVDFASNTIIGVFDGSHRVDGYSIKVNNITEKDGEIIIHVKKSCSFIVNIFSNAITFPYHIIKINVVNKKVIFEGIKEKKTKKPKSNKQQIPVR